MPFTRETKLITVAQAQEIIPCVSREYIRNLIKAGEMKGAKYGNSWHTTEDWVCEYVEKKASETQARLCKMPIEREEVS